jgi:D-arabinose 1-dehydrogenase-like Zn-dependent alcohol dehydrogenase
MDFCSRHNIVAKVEVIKASQLDEVYAALERKHDGVVRYVLDIAASS